MKMCVTVYRNRCHCHGIEKTTKTIYLHYLFIFTWNFSLAEALLLSHCLTLNSVSFLSRQLECLPNVKCYSRKKQKSQTEKIVHIPCIKYTLIHTFLYKSQTIKFITSGKHEEREKTPAIEQASRTENGNNFFIFVEKKSKNCLRGRFDGGALSKAACK